VVASERKSTHHLDELLCNAAHIPVRRSFADVHYEVAKQLLSTWSRVRHLGVELQAVHPPTATE
jgi:hypothetical protein